MRPFPHKTWTERTMVRPSIPTPDTSDDQPASGATVQEAVGTVRLALDLAATAPTLAALYEEAVASLAATFDAARVIVFERDSEHTLRLAHDSAPTERGARDAERRALEVLVASALGAGRLATSSTDRDGQRVAWDVPSMPVDAAAALIPGPITPYGVIAVASRPGRAIDADGVVLLDGYAGALAFGIDRLRAADALETADAALRGAFDDAHIPMALTRLDGHLRRVNSACANMLGYSTDELYGMNIQNIVHQDDRSITADSSAALARGDIPLVEIECRMILRSGGTIRALVRMSLLGDPAGRPFGYLAQFMDLPDARPVDADPWSYGQDFRAMVESMPDIIARFDRDMRYVYVNPAIEQLTGIPRAAFIGRTHAELDLPETFAEQWRAHLANVLAEEREITAEVAYSSTPVDRTFLVRLTPEPGPTGEVETVLAVARDITDRRALAERLQFQALHDALTGLPNRTLMLDRLQHALARSRRHRQPVALLFLDLDNFKTVNDTLGHAAGDKLLVQVARRLERSVRSEDTVARFGGDEFAVLLPHIANAGSALEVAERIAQAISQPFEIGHNEAFVTTSIGVALSESPDDYVDELLHRADSAMYRAKSTTKNRFELYDAAMQAEASGRLQRVSDLRAATERNDFLLLYQPVIDLTTGRVAGVEALVRWRHPERGIVAPVEFMTLAEETSLIIPLGYWAIDAAARQERQWQAGSPGDSPVPVSVNLSARQFRHPGLVAEVRRTLDATGLNPALLSLEVAEQVVMTDSAVAATTLDSLKALGVGLCIDDFGTGSSSLRHLRRLPVDAIKIDRECLREIDRNADQAAITAAIIAMAKALGLRTIAEGVETPAQVARLRELGSDEAQGYVFSHPLPAEEITRLRDAHQG
jgi:diguanylate cyclase (GGDEF)-like protein/PAS domain S-box-containing protein